MKCDATNRFILSKETELPQRFIVLIDGTEQGCNNILGPCRTATASGSGVYLSHSGLKDRLVRYRKQVADRVVQPPVQDVIEDARYRSRGFARRLIDIILIELGSFVRTEPEEQGKSRQTALLRGVDGFGWQN